MTRTSRTPALRGPATEGEPAIALRGVRRTYATASRLNVWTGTRVVPDHVEAVRGIDLSTARGDLFTLLGTTAPARLPPSN